MSPFQLEPREVLLECLALHGIFNKLGFDTKDIFIVTQEHAVQVLLRQGDVEFVADMGHVEDTNGFCDSWVKAVGWWNVADDQIRTEIIEKSRIRDRAVELLMAMAMKGIDLPKNQIQWN